MELAVFETLPSLACSTNLPSVEVWDFMWARNSDPDSELKHVQTTVLSDIASLKGHLTRPREERTTRIITMSKAYSWAPFDIPKEMLQEIIAQLNVTPEILPVFFSFRRQTNRLEEAFSDSVWVSSSKDLTELTYLLKYTETRNSSEAKADWSIRQIGVYHRYDPHAMQSTWILLFPTADSSTRRDLVNELSSTCDMEQTAYHPLSLHVSLMQARIHNWRLYANLAFTVDFESTMPFQDAYKDILDLHYIETRLATLPPIFDAQLELVGQLDSLNERFFHRSQVSEETCSKMKETLGNLRRRLEAYNANVAFVLGKIRSTTQLVSDTIDFKSQHTTEKLSKGMLRDSTSMRVITLVTLVYLPSTFVATFFGMGFFASRDDAGVHWTSSPYVWLFFGLAIPLTLLTLGYWRWSLRREVRSRVMQDLAKSSA
ncbi:hypothetical protein AA0112_g8545 [Alternaria arborescens]|nr:hypothetical protein AA0112_g8545 [Alternaria arborescens]